MLAEDNARHVRSMSRGEIVNRPSPTKGKLFNRGPSESRMAKICRSIEHCNANFRRSGC